MKSRLVFATIGLALLFLIPPLLAESFPNPTIISSGWQLQAVSKVPQSGAEISSASFQPAGWYSAIVPGTVLTTLVSNKVYPEPLYGENNRPDQIPESLCRTSYWYRTVFTVPKDYEEKKIWLNFDGINYAAEVWVNGKNIGAIKGAFTRGIFDISSVVTPGKEAALAVLISPQPHPGVPHEHTLANGMGGNGGVTAIDGPTFLCSMGWDWIPAIRDRNSGIWQKVFLSATGPVVVKNPLVTSDLPLPRLDMADVAIQVTLQNVTDKIQKGVLKGNFGDVSFEQPVEIEANSSKLVSLDSTNVPALHLKNPKLWWPNGYGPQNLYTLHLNFDVDGKTSDSQDVTFGIRKITYSVPDSENLTISVNGVRVFCKGGDWGMDEAMKRIPRERLEAEIRMHQIANYTIIRNWVGQSTSEDFYELCDKYGILLWDEFFQPNPGDGPNPTDMDAYIANVREKILRYRNHPSIAVWCARNEGFPPKNIDDELRKLMAELEPVRLYQPSSTSGHGVNSGGPYGSGHPPRSYYDFGEAFKTEIGSASIPTLESIQGMMPEKDWESINDDWAEHDLAKGASGGEGIRKTIENRYGDIKNLADFVRKAQLLNYETFRAIYEGREARMFHPSTGVIIWMSNPAQPSFVWQIYHHDLEPNSSLFAVKEACEPVHIMLNEKNGNLMVVNNHPEALTDAKARISFYNLDGSIVTNVDVEVKAAPSAITDLGLLALPDNLSSVYFVKLELHGADGKLLSDNFYWHALKEHQDDLRDFNQLPTVTLDEKVSRHDADGKCLLDVMLHNPSSQVALMAHLQLRREKSGERVLPVYYTDNYISLTPNESKTISIEAAQSDLKGEKPLVAVDGWNIGITSVSSSAVAVALNANAQVDRWPVTGLPIVPSTHFYFGTPADHFKINCGGAPVDNFDADGYFAGGKAGGPKNDLIDTSATNAGPTVIYQTERWGDCVYTFPMKPLPKGHAYTVRLHFAETTFDAAGKRAFNVVLNGKQVLSDFDVFQESGGKDKVLVKEFSGITPDEKGNIVIKFQTGSADKPKINAIEILN
ncbi:MAG TPA: malectin domain-containing carbohydrate-binding protein [Methylomirabilota bacterium]|nr:malectin domain-containing carbohydrate-binding protein [Methylomirabilota bacterium]